MLRQIDISLTSYPFPGPPPGLPPPRTVHSERVSESRTRAEVMGFLQVVPFVLGQHPEEISMEVTFTVDPAPGTHLETYYPERWWYPFDEHEIPLEMRPYLAMDISQVPTEYLVREAAIVDLYNHTGTIDITDLERAGKHIRNGDAVFIKTGWSEKYHGEKWRDFFTHPEYYMGEETPGLSVDAAKWLVKKNICILGIDVRGPESPKLYKEGLPVHKIMHLHRVGIIEDLANLSQVEEDRVLSICGTPVKGRYLTGVAARVVAIQGDIRGENIKVVDLSHTMHIYPEPELQRLPPPFSLVEPFELKSSIRKRFRIIPFEVGQMGIDDTVGPMYITFTTHLGTHLEFPYFDPLGRGIPPQFLKDVSEVPLDKLVGQATIIDLPHIGARQLIDVRELEEAGSHIQEGDIAIVRTDWTDRYYNMPEFLDYTPGFSVEAVEWLVDSGVKALVTDVGSIERQTPSKGAPPDNDALYTLFKYDVPVVECAQNLWMVRKERLFTANLPLKIKGLNASPVHSFIVEGYQQCMS